MKKMTKRLSLNRETVRNLSAAELKLAHGGFLSLFACSKKCGGGGGGGPVPYTEVYLCTTPGVCVQDTEDCDSIIQPK